MQGAAPRHDSCGRATLRALRDGLVAGIKLFGKPVRFWTFGPKCIHALEGESLNWDVIDDQSVTQKTLNETTVTPEALRVWMRWLSNFMSRSE
ncbi:MAG: hypothetical protein CBARDMAM_0975 [uncultured Caballeronia sp.]|nr:MAG: hypothetical protein CBARDMAM_0975 [uncultured Caballeronia sp.]